MGLNRLGDESPSNVIGVNQEPAESAAEELLAVEEPESPGVRPELRPRTRLTLLNMSLAIAGLRWLVDHSSALFAGSSGAWAPLGELAFEFLIIAGVVYAIAWTIRWVYRLVQRRSKAQQTAVLAVVIALVGGSVIVATAPTVRELTRVSTLAFGTGGTECSLVNIASSFPADTPIRVAAEFSPPLSAYTVTDMLIWQDGRELIDLGSTTVPDVETTCISKSFDALAAGHYRLDVLPGNGTPISGEFDVTP